MNFCFVFVADEQERVQKKTFVNWINSYLSKVRSRALPKFNNTVIDGSTTFAISE